MFTFLNLFTKPTKHWQKQSRQNHQVKKIHSSYRQHCRLTISRLVEFVKSEANPNNNLMMRRAGLSKHWCNFKSLLELLQCLQSDVQFSIDVCKYMLTTFIVLIIDVNLKTETVNNPPAFPHNTFRCMYTAGRKLVQIFA